MFTKGQKVVCVDDVFCKEARVLFAQLPVKGVVYTVRACYIGRGKVRSVNYKDPQPEIGVLLEELKNGPDVLFLGNTKPEVGFNGERFVPLATVPPKNKAFALPEDEPGDGESYEDFEKRKYGRKDEVLVPAGGESWHEFEKRKHTHA